MQTSSQQQIPHTPSLSHNCVSICKFFIPCTIAQLIIKKRKKRKKKEVAINRGLCGLRECVEIMARSNQRERERERERGAGGGVFIGQITGQGSFRRHHNLEEEYLLHIYKYLV